MQRESAPSSVVESVRAMAAAVAFAAAEAERRRGSVDDRLPLAVSALERLAAGEWSVGEAADALGELGLREASDSWRGRDPALSFALHAAATAAVAATDPDYWPARPSAASRLAVMEAAVFALTACREPFDAAQAAVASAVNAATLQPTPGDVASLARRLSGYDPSRYEHLLPAYFAEARHPDDAAYLRFDARFPHNFLSTARARYVEGSFRLWLSRAAARGIDPGLSRDPAGLYSGVRVARSAWLLYFVSDPAAAIGGLPGSADVRELGARNSTGWCVGHPSDVEVADRVARQSRYARRSALLVRADAAVGTDEEGDADAVFWGPSVRRAVPLSREGGDGNFWVVGAADGSPAWSGRAAGERGLWAAASWAAPRAQRMGLWRAVG